MTIGEGITHIEARQTRGRKQGTSQTARVSGNRAHVSELQRARNTRLNLNISFNGVAVFCTLVQRVYVFLIGHSKDL